MKKNIKDHLGYYIVFTVTQIIGFALVLSLAGNKQLQFPAILMMTIIYFTFGIVHHMINHDLTQKIVVEYALMGSFGLAIAIFLFSV